MAQKLYAGNVSFDVTEEQLRTLFSEFGKVVTATLVTDSYSPAVRVVSDSLKWKITKRQSRH